MGEAAGGGTRRRKKGGGGDREAAVAREGGGKPGQSVPGVTGAPGPQPPQGMWTNRGPQGPFRPQWGPQHPWGAGRIFPTPYWAGALRELGKAAPRPPHASPQTHSHTTVPLPGRQPLLAGQGAALVPAPVARDQGDRVA